MGAEPAVLQEHERPTCLTHINRRGPSPPKNRGANTGGRMRRRVIIEGRVFWLAAREVGGLGWTWSYYPEDEPETEVRNRAALHRTMEAALRGAHDTARATLAIPVAAPKEKPPRSGSA